MVNVLQAWISLQALEEAQNRSACLEDEARHLREELNMTHSGLQEARVRESGPM
jgi:hypothetical protein